MTDPHTTTRRLARDTHGAVYVEFILAFLPVFVLVLGMTQMAMLYAGHLVVQHASQCAVRAAIVVLPDDPARYGGDAVDTLTQPSHTSATPTSAVDAMVQVVSSRLGLGVTIPGFGATGAGSGHGTYANPNNRYMAIHDAASIPLLAISPSPNQLLQRFTNLGRAIGDENPGDRAIAGATVYNRAAMAVTFPDAPGSTTYVDHFDSSVQPTVTARVTYAFQCAVPIARVFMCNTVSEIVAGAISGETTALVSPGDGATGASVASIGARLAATRPGVLELQNAPLFDLWNHRLPAGNRYLLIRSEASLPLQGAGYAYASQGGPAAGVGGGGP